MCGGIREDVNRTLGHQAVSHHRITYEHDSIFKSLRNYVNRERSYGEADPLVNQSRTALTVHGRSLVGRPTGTKSGRYLTPLPEKL